MSGRAVAPPAALAWSGVLADQETKAIGADHPRVSVVTPVYNEAESLKALFAEVDAAMAAAGLNFEMIFVDDGSSDESAAVIAALAATSPAVRAIEFRRNFGKAAALDAGFKAATGDVVITMDADLQDNPVEIPRFLEKLRAGYDVVSGWKKERHDPLGKTAPSKVFNAVVSRLSGVKLNDFNCGFKAYRAEALEGLTLYGELHRFIPVLLHWRGFKVGEIVVNHRPRQFGVSKFGAERLLKGALDLLTVILNTRFRTRPLHIFGLAGALMGLAGAAILGYLSVLLADGAGADRQSAAALSGHAARHVVVPVLHGRPAGRIDPAPEQSGKPRLGRPPDSQS